MIQIRHEKPGLTVVLAICDTCGKEITDAAEGVATWRFDREHRTGPVDYRLCHKGHCDDHRFECSMILDVFLTYLLHNTGMTKEKLAVARNNARGLAAI